MSWDITDIKNWDWRKHPLGGQIRDVGNAKQFKTGGWRSARPLWDEDKCSQCRSAIFSVPIAPLRPKMKR